MHTYIYKSPTHMFILCRFCTICYCAHKSLISAFACGSTFLCPCVWKRVKEREKQRVREKEKD